MLNKELFNFSIKLLLKDKSSYIFSFFIFSFIVFILSSVLFISSSIKFDLTKALKSQNQITIYNQKAGHEISIDESILDEVLQLTGVSNVYGKIDGYYYFNSAKTYFHLIGNDDISEENMIIGQGVRNILNQYYYKDFFNFYVDEQKYKINIQKTLDPNTNIITSNTIVLNTQIAQEILNLSEDEYSYLQVQIPNDSEIDYIVQSIQERYPNLIVRSTSDNISDLENLFYYKGGVFMIVYIVALISFFVLLYKQISSINSVEKKQIAILRSVGFTINHIIAIKFIQNFIVSVGSYIFAVCLAYIYVFKANGLILKNIFLGLNMSDITFTPIIPTNILVIIFIFTVVPFLLAIIIPSWKSATTNITEAMK
jgi:ABC-type lipoprotein release transport system permease subunit